ncbi:MAG TPA: tetratricopeptide repeat protein [Xanthobacteraceae bacterium]
MFRQAGGFVAALLIGLIAGLAIAKWNDGGLTLGSFAMSQSSLQAAEADFRSGDDRTAAAKFSQLADQNNPAAQYWLAHMTELGLGVPRDPAKAVELYRKAAAQNDLSAELRLGEIYLYGDLVPPDFSLAKSYLDKAAFQGNSRAAMLLGQMYRLGMGTAVDQKEAYAWSEVSALEGDVTARRERDASLRDLAAGDQTAAIARAQQILSEIKPHTPVASKEAGQSGSNAAS